VIYDGMPYDPIQVKVMEVWSVRKLQISQYISSAGMHVIKRLTGNY